MASVLVQPRYYYLRENNPVGTLIGELISADSNVSIVSATMVSSRHVGISPETGGLDFAGDFLKIVGNQIFLNEELDYEKYEAHTHFQTLNFFIDATLSDGSHAEILKSFAIVDVIEDVRGTGKADVINGTGAMDKVIAGAGDDKVYAGFGDDILYGGTGSDTLHGGFGSDRFLYKAINESTVKNPDTILYWQHIEGGDRDKIDLREIDARSDYSGNQAFKWLGVKDFSGKKGELRYDHKGETTYVYADLNGDKKADFAIKIEDNIKMSADDFLL